MDTKITTPAQRLHLAKQVMESIEEEANTSYYLFYGNHDPSITDVPNINESFKENLIDPYFNMIAGKRLSSSDMVLAIRNIPYVTSTIYDMYDDTDMELSTKDYYVITNEGSYKHVYKCLDNNNGSLSTIEPSFSHVTGSNSYVYQTSDGYRWKYMYSVSSSMDLKFSTSSYFPIFANSVVEETASYGTVDIIKVDGQGQKYDNYVSGIFSTQHIQINGNSYIYEISNSVASTTNNFYSGCLLYITNGTAAGEYVKVTNYVSNDSGKFVVLDSAFGTTPTNGDEYEIYPRVDVVGSGINLVNCVARALVNSLSTNSVYRVEILDRGSGYINFYSANVYADSSVGVVLPAELRIINPPPGGHGANSALELGSNGVMISVKVSNNEGGSIPANNGFKQFGILKDPVFSNVAIQTTEAFGEFLVGEKVFQIKPIRVDSAASVSITSNTVTSIGSLFENQFSAGDRIYLRSTDGLNHQLSTVSSVTSNTELVMASNALFLDSTASLFITNTYSYGYFVSSNATHILLANVVGQFVTGDELIGETTGIHAYVDTININGVQKGFDTFVQMYKYKGVMNFGEFQNNEWAWQSNVYINQYSSALVHSTEAEGSNTIIYVTKQQGDFRVGGANTLTGNTSGAVAQLTEKYSPDLIPGSGHILFIENLEEVTRSNTTSETFKVLLSF